MPISLRPLVSCSVAVLVLALSGCGETASPILLPNTAPSVAIVQPIVPQDADFAGPFSPDGGVVVEARVVDAEDEPSELRIRWSAVRTDQGQSDSLDLGETSADSAGSTTRIVTELGPGRWLLTVTGTDSDGAEADANLPLLIAEANQAPSLAILAPAPGSEHIAGQPVTFSAAVTDDGALNALQVEWFSPLDGVLNTSSPSGTGALAFSDSNLTVGQHMVTLTVTDPGGLSASADVSFEVLPANLAPSAPTVDVQPDPAGTLDDLSCIVTVASSDPEGLLVTHSYAWLRDGSPTAFSDPVLDAGETSRGEAWTCEVRGNDGVLQSVAGSDTLVIANSVPSVGGVTLGPSPATEASVLSCVGAGWQDDDGDAEGYQVSWEVNGVLLTNGAATLTGADFDRGDSVACGLTPDDGFDLGATLWSPSLVIENTAPSAPTVTVTPAPSAALSLPLLCAASGSSDLDGDSFLYLYRWSRDGVLQPAWSASASVPASATSLGDLWTCEVQADDGSDSSPWIGASTTVLPAPGDLVFSEFLANPDVVSDPAGEWVEIYNASGTLLDLGGFELHDDGSDSHIISGSLSVPAGGRVVLARNADTATNGGVQADYEYTGFVLDNTADELVLSFDGIEIDRFNYTLGSWAGITGHAVSLDPALGAPDATVNDAPSAWCGSMEPLGSPGTDYGTPGQANDSCSCFPSDGDGDGYGIDPSCSLYDCNDANPAINPAATDVCENGLDEDCTGADALCSCLSTDLDNDGYGTGAACPQLDCNDANSNVNPGAAEVCNGVDDDCDVLIDEGWDADGDGYTTCNGDCDDGTATTWPGAPELCNGVNDDCDGQVDEGFDLDGDSWTSCNGDCNDNNPAIYPNALDVCDGVDQDCDGTVDENATGDVFEPNGSASTAYSIGGDDLIVDLWATFHLASDLDDWYSLYTVDDTDLFCDQFYISVTMDSLPPGTDYDIYLYNSGLGLLASSIGVGSVNEALSWTPGCTSWGDDGGTYYVRVDRWSGWSCGDTYHLQVTNQY